MLEILKNCKSIEKSLLEKLICFESFRKMFFETEPMLAAQRVTDEKVSTLVDMGKKTLKNLEKNISVGQIKLSQQETCFDETRSMSGYWRKNNFF